MSIVSKIRKRAETLQIWLAVAIALVLSVYRLSTELSAPLRHTIESHTRLPVADFMANLLFLMLLGLLGLAYGRWRRAVLRQQELERIVSGINPDALMVVEPDRRVSMCNRAVETMFGYRVDEVIGQRTDLLYDNRCSPERPHEVREALDRIGFHTGYATGRRRDGSAFPVEIVTGKIPGRRGAVVLVRDITERRRAEEQLLAAKREAEAATQAKTEALAQLEQNYVRLRELEALRDNLTHMVVHDLKSPLFTLSGFIDRLARRTADRLDADDRLALEEAGKLTRFTRYLVGSLLDIYRFENHQMPLQIEATDLCALVRQALQIVGMEQVPRVFEVDCPPTLPKVNCDPEIICRVLINLLTNAIQFTKEQGHVTLRAAVEGGEMAVTVSDDGPGIPTEFQPKLFTRFAQAEARKYSSGLGLYFCRLAVEAHGGRIGVTSAPGHGATFRFSLPLASAP